MSATNQQANGTATATSLNWERFPCVQYGFPENVGLHREPKLRTVFEEIPEGANTVSPIYILTELQFERQESLESGYQVAGDYNSIATELQDECEERNQVLYPIHVESDVYHEQGPATLVEWFRKFIEDYLNVPFSTCRLYFSGNRSIHAHVPRFVNSEQQRKRLKELAERYCDETGAELDCGLYSAKRLFRLPGVEHEKSGLPKVEIEPEWSRDRIMREATSTTPGPPESYEAVLRDVFLSQLELRTEPTQMETYSPTDLFRFLDSENTIAEFTASWNAIETPLIEAPEFPEKVTEQKRWLQYNAKEFSPYARADGNSRSVAALKVKGGAFARSGTRNGATLIPAHFYGARGCAGKEFTKSWEHAPLQLSKIDYEKWELEKGDCAVIIGGKSRNSRILNVSRWEAEVVGHALTGDEGSKTDALSYLKGEGYDVGDSGHSGTRTNTESLSGGSDESETTNKSSQTEATVLQHQAERDDINALSHKERSRVACRLLKKDGWEGAWEWFKEQFGDDFDPDITRQQFQSIINAYPEDYGHISQP